MRKVLIIAALLMSAQSALATITFSQHQTKTACSNPCSVTGFTAIPAGSLIIMVAYNDSGTLTPSAGASNAGTWVIPSGCATNTNCSQSSAARAVIVQYILSSTGTPTTIICTGTGGMPECDVSVYTFTGTSMAFDVGDTRSATAAANLAGVSAGTLTGTNDVIFQLAVGAGSFSVCPNSAASPTAFPNGNAACGLVNSTNVTAGTYTNTSGAAFLTAIAFKEAQPAATARRATLLGIGP